MAKQKEDLGQRFYRIIETLFRELDQESIMAEVEALQKKKPKASREQIAKELITRTSRKTALVGATAGIPGGSFGLLAAAPDIFNLVRSQSRMVLSIAFLYDQKPGLEERFREVLAVLALSTGASATRQGVRYLIAKGLTGKTAEAIMKKVAGRFLARRIPTLAPLVGSVAGAGLNYMAVQAAGKVAIEYYAAEREKQGADPKLISGDQTPEAGVAKKPRKKAPSKAKTSSGTKAADRIRSSSSAAKTMASSKETAAKKSTSSKSTAAKKKPSGKTRSTSKKTSGGGTES